MAEADTELGVRLEELLECWRREGLPSRQGLAEAAGRIARWRDEVGGLFGVERPLLATATLDDGWGNGLRSIELLAEAAGLEVRRLGLLLTAERIVEGCRELAPRWLGLTVLQLDSEDALGEVVRSVPDGTEVVAGGPAFALEPELATRTGVGFVARDAAAFLAYLLAAASRR